MSKDTINTNFKIKQKFLWHSSGIYCLTFDRSGQFILTGSDDGVVKIYSITDNKLVKTLTDGSESNYIKELEIICQTLDENEVNTLEKKMEKHAICDICINYDNTLIAAGKQMGLIPVWNLQTGQLIVNLNRHGFQITSVKFSALNIGSDHNFLISTSTDGFMFFWSYDRNSYQFKEEPEFKKTKYDSYRAQKICPAFSSGTVLIGVIHTFQMDVKSPSKPKSKKSVEFGNQVQSAIRIFSFDDDSGPLEVWKTTHIKSHEECTYSLKFSNIGFRFASGCNADSNASVWSFDKANKKWDQIIININKKDSNKVLRVRGKANVSVETVFLEEITWSCNDTYIITTLSDDSIKVWKSESGELVRHYDKNHTDKIVVLESHPIFDNIFLSGGFDGGLFIYDITKETILIKLQCSIKADKQEISPINQEIDVNQDVKPSILQSSFSPDGFSIGATDSYGNLTVFSLEKEKDIYDQLEQSLERIHGELDEDNSEEALVSTVKRSNSDFLEMTKTKFDYEIHLLKGIDRHSVRSSMSSDKSIDSKSDIKTVVNTVIKPKDVKKNIKPKVETIDDKNNKEDDYDVNNESSDNSDDDKSVTGVTNNKTPDMKKGKALKSDLRAVLNAIFENPNSAPFQIVDHMLYPTYRKDILNADLSLSSIREDIETEGRYGFARFRNDMNQVFHNAKKFFKQRDQSIYQMALDLEKFYHNQMDTWFGNMWKLSHKKVPNKVNKESDDEMKVDANVFQASTSGCDIVMKPHSDSVEKSFHVNLNKAKPMKRERKIAYIRDFPRLTSVKRQLKRGKNLNVIPIPKPVDLQQKNQSKNGKRDLDPQLSSNNKRIRKSTKESLNSSSVNDLSKETIINKVNDQETNGNTEDYSSRDSSFFDANHFHANVVESHEESHEDDDELPVIQESINSHAFCEKTSVNGLKTQNNSTSDTPNDSIVIKETPYFCIFCDQSFVTKSDASSHYIMHLCPLRCRDCDQKFASYDKFLSHNNQHSKSIEWCQHYRDSNVWINNFLVYQKKPDIQTFVYKECIVCQRIEQHKPRSNTSPVKELTIHHLKEHLKYDPKYKCLVCFLNEDDDIFCYSFDEAKEHLKTDHDINETDDPFIHFDSKIPKLDEIINKSKRMFESN